MANTFQITMIATIVTLVSFVSFTTAYGHGLGGETHPPVTLDGRDVTLSIDISPSTFDSNESERYIAVNLNESKSQAVVEHVTFALEIEKDGEQIFRRLFHDDLGNLVIKVINDGSDEIKIKGGKSPAIEAWMRTVTEPVIMTGPVFDSGGLYDYKIEILTVDSDFNFLDKRLELVGAISLAEHNIFKVNDSEQNTHQLNVISYFDTINNFEYNSDRVSFSMPFDWNQDFDQLSVVHQEVRIPENFFEFLHTKYEVKVNDIKLEDNVVTIDDYSFDERTVHMLINKKDLEQMREQAKQKSDSEMFFELGPGKDDIKGNESSNVNFLIDVKPSEKAKFPIELKSVSKSSPNDGKYVVDLTWFPNTLTLGESEFIITFYEKDTGLTVQDVTYDFVLIKNGSEIHRKSGFASAGGTFENFVFVEREAGDVTVRIEKIAGTDEYVEIPISVTPEFPVGISIVFVTMMILIITLSKIRFFKIPHT